MLGVGENRSCLACGWAYPVENPIDIERREPVLREKPPTPKKYPRIGTEELQKVRAMKGGEG